MSGLLILDQIVCCCCWWAIFKPKALPANNHAFHCMVTSFLAQFIILYGISSFLKQTPQRLKSHISLVKCGFQSTPGQPHLTINHPLILFILSYIHWHHDMPIRILLHGIKACASHTTTIVSRLRYILAFFYQDQINHPLDSLSNLFCYYYHYFA